MTRDDLLEAFAHRITRPTSARELMQTLKVPREARASFRRLLRSLVTDGDLVQIRGHRFGLPGKMDLVVGRLQMHRDGYGFVVPEHADGAGDVFVSPAQLREAMHGDRVVARVEHRREEGRREGRVLRILERGSERIVGRFEVDGSGLGYVVPHDRRLPHDVHVPRGEHGQATPGDMVELAITRWPTATRGPIGRVTEVFGPLETPGVDVRVILAKHGIVDTHGDAALHEAARLGAQVRDADLLGRTDFREWPTITIDGEHARDFDDAITLERLPSGHFWLGVHIADVAHYVPEGSALDREAYERGTSVYFPERAVHMFPAGLATGLCSLNPMADRLVQSCLMEFDRHGTLVRHEFHDGVIRSDARMTYTVVNAILADRDAALIDRYRAFVPLLDCMHDLFLLLHRRRERRGSIDFDLPEPEIVLDAGGLVEAILPAERNVAHRLIEEFMLVANETVATYLEAQESPAVFRTHEAPDPVKVAEFDQFVSSLGFRLNAGSGGPAPRDFQRLVERIRGTPVERPVAFLLLRTMQQARYEAVNRGHFGLATASYTHFTSPIRRYPDLVVHRLLRLTRRAGLTAELKDRLDRELPESARHASERERRAMEAEREVVHWKKVRFMADKVGDEFDGYVTGVTAFGVFVQLTEHFVEGLVHVSTMGDDYYRYLEHLHALKGEHTGTIYRLGDRVRVQVVRVDLERRLIDLGLVEVLDAVRAARGGPSRPRVRARPPGRPGPPVARRRTRARPPRRRR
ncbi:MAG: ribonuclease R [Acidobacteriota bacterium]